MFDIEFQPDDYISVVAPSAERAAQMVGVSRVKKVELLGSRQMRQGRYIRTVTAWAVYTTD